MLTNNAKLPADMTDQHENVFLERFGAVHGVVFEYRIDSRGLVVATGRIHPANSEFFDWSVNDDVTYATAHVVLGSQDERTAAALRQHIRQHLQ